MDRRCDAPPPYPAGVLLDLGPAHPLAATLVACWAALVTPALVRHDLAEHRLPNRLVHPGWPLAGIALVTAAIERGAAPVAALVAGVATAVALIGLALGGGLGMGDAKLAVPLAIGLALAHPARIAIAAPVALGIGAIAALVALARTRDRRARIPFGPPLLLGYWTGWLA